MLKIKLLIPFIFCFFIISCSHVSNKEQFIISGRLLTESGEPLADGVIRLKGKKFVDIYEVKTDRSGHFSIKADEGQYLALYAVKNYLTQYLEFWYWDLFLNRDIKKDIRINTLEIYGVKAWKTFGGLMVYFRPMSLNKYKRLQPKGPNDPVAKGKSVLPTLQNEDVQIYVNQQLVKVRRLEKVQEISSQDGSTIEGLLVNTSFPDSLKNTDSEILEVCIEAKDKVENEFGMACYDMRNLPWSF